MYDWQGQVVPANQLEKTLEGIAPPWEVFAILPASAQVGQPFTGTHFLIVIRKRR